MKLDVQEVSERGALVVLLGHGGACAEVPHAHLPLVARCRHEAAILRLLRVRGLSREDRSVREEHHRLERLAGEMRDQLRMF